MRSLLWLSIFLLSASICHAETDPSIVHLDIRVASASLGDDSARLPYKDDYCFLKAEDTYHISASILWSLSRLESGHNVRAVNKNANGTLDYCHMQINSGWRRYIGKENWARLEDPCYCTMVGAWILAQCIQKHGYTWEAIGCYHSPNRARGMWYARKVHNLLEGASNSGQTP